MKLTVVLPERAEIGSRPALISRWLKPVGISVQENEPLVEVRTEAGSFPVSSPAAGILVRIVAPEGEPVEVGEPLAVLSIKDRAGPIPSAARPVPGGEEAEVVPLTTAQKLLAEHMARSVRTSPHVSTIVAVDMAELAGLRERVTGSGGVLEREGVRLTFLPFIMKSVADALVRYPALNSQLVGEEIHRKKYVHIGVAVSVEGTSGSIVPVIRDADKKSLLALARELSDASARARAGTLRTDEVRGATFSIADPGAFGALLQTPIIHQPQAALLSIGQIEKMPAVVDDEIVMRSRMHLCLATDHRIVDGETAARFLADIKHSLEEVRFLFP